VAVEDMRQGGDPRLPLELALVKVTRPHADLSRESLAHRVELLEAGRPHPSGEGRISASGGQGPTSASGGHRPNAQQEPEASATTLPTAAPEGPELALEQVADAWQRSIVEAVRERSIPVASLLTEARPKGLDGDTLTLEFPPGAEFHRKQVSEPGNIGVLRDALYEVTGRKLAVVLETGEAGAEHEVDDDEPLSEEDVISLLKETLDAEEVTDEP
jgi:hypothetical protein